MTVCAGPTPFVARYRAMLDSPDPLARELARRQLAALGRSRRKPAVALDEAETGDGSLVLRIEATVGPLRRRPNSSAEGRCPWHGSKSGRCLVVFAGGRRWWCRDCNRGGDVAAWVAALEGITYGEACRRLGLPVERRPVRRPTLSVEVVL